MRHSGRPLRLHRGSLLACHQYSRYRARALAGRILPALPTAARSNRRERGLRDPWRSPPPPSAFWIIGSRSLCQCEDESGAIRRRFPSNHDSDPLYIVRRSEAAVICHPRIWRAGRKRVGPRWSHRRPCRLYARSVGRRHGSVSCQLPLGASHLFKATGWVPGIGSLDLERMPCRPNDAPLSARALTGWVTARARSPAHRHMDHRRRCP